MRLIVYLLCSRVCKCTTNVTVFHHFLVFYGTNRMSSVTTYLDAPLCTFENSLSLTSYQILWV